VIELYFFARKRRCRAWQKFGKNLSKYQQIKSTTYEKILWVVGQKGGGMYRETFVVAKIRHRCAWCCQKCLTALRTIGVDALGELPALKE
jgi:hypothetical protein